MIKSPYPYFGSKRQVADIIWKGLGKVTNYVEPFAGSFSILLASPYIPKIETVNDKDALISNFWRAVSKDPEGVAEYADYPVHETELHARHQYINLNANQDFFDKMNSDVDFYDLKIAGYWIWGMGASIGNNWLKPKGLNSMPAVSSAGNGIHGLTKPILQWFKELQERTRRVRVCCGDWSKIVTPSITYKSKGISNKDITGVVLDPPYDYKGRDKVYKEETNVFKDVCKWAVENGENKSMRIVLCGYEGDFTFPDTWKTYSWTTGGGFSSLGDSRGKDNKSRERIYFSPYCLSVE